MTTTPTLIRDPWRRTWHFLSGDLFLTFALILCTLLLIVAGLLPQTPQNDPIAYSRWLSETQQRFGNLHPLLNSLGFFTVFQSILFRLSLAAIGLSSSLRLIDQIDRLRAKTDQSAPARSIYAAIGIYAGVLIILLGLIVGTFTDYRIDHIDLEPEQISPINGTNFALQLNSFTAQQDQVNLTLLQNGNAIASGQIGPIAPTFNQRPVVYFDQFGPALIVSATDANQHPIDLQRTADSLPMPQDFISFSIDHPEGFVAAPQANIVLQIQKDNGSAYKIQAYQTASGNILTNTTISPNTSLVIDQTTFTFQPAAFVIVSLVDQPSHYFIGFGFLLTFIGLIGSIKLPLTRVVLIDLGLWVIISLTFIIQTFSVYRHLASIDDLNPALIGAWLSISGSLITDRRKKIALLVVSLLSLLIMLMANSR